MCALTFSLALLHIPPDPHRPSSAPVLGDRSRIHNRSKLSTRRVEQDSLVITQAVASTLQGAHHFSIDGSPQFYTVGTQNNVTNFGSYGDISLVCYCQEMLLINHCRLRHSERVCLFQRSLRLLRARSQTSVSSRDTCKCPKTDRKLD